MSASRRRWQSTFLLAVLLGSFWLVPWLNQRIGFGIDWQRQPSNPFRLYLHLKTVSHYQRGDYVPFAMQGFAPLVPDGTLFVKRVVGVAGDRIELRQDALWLNDQPVAAINPVILAKVGLSQSRLSDLAVIPEGQVLLLGASANSFDSRYFGLVYSTQLRGQAWPLW